MVHIIDNHYGVIQPGAIHPGWYYDHTIGSNIPAGGSLSQFGWAYYGYFWGGSYSDVLWDGWGPWGEGWMYLNASGNPVGRFHIWDYSQFVGPYLSYAPNGLGGYYWNDLAFSYYHGAWNYWPGVTAGGAWIISTWTPWTPNYLGNNTGLANQTTIDVDADLQQYQSTLESLTASTEVVTNTLSVSKDQSPPTISAARGIVVDGSGAAYLADPTGSGGGDPAIDTTPVSLDEWADRLTIAGGGSGVTLSGSTGPFNVADDVLTQLRLRTGAVIDSN